MQVAEIENRIAAVADKISENPDTASKVFEIEAQVGGWMDAKIAAVIATLTSSRGLQN